MELLIVLEKYIKLKV